MEKIFHKILSIALYSLIFLIPFFFLNITQEFFITNKLYLLVFGVLLLFTISAIEIFVTKKMKWDAKPLDLPVVLFMVSLLLSVIFSSPNKVQALLNPNFGLVMMISLTILYFYLSRSQLISTNFIKSQLISVIISLLTVVFFFQPFKNISLTSSWQFLKNPLFTPLGSQFDLLVFLGFFVIFNIFHVIASNQGERNNLIINSSFLVVNLVALFLTLYRIFTNSIILPPFSTSWYAVLEVMKNVKTAFFGVGLDNFSVAFTKVKNIAYNQSPFWQIGSFSVARNLPLQFLVEVGILGFLSFVFLIFSVFKQFSNSKNKAFIWLFAYLSICLLILPPSLSILFFLFVFLSIIVDKQSQPKQTDLSEFPVLYLGITLIILAVVGVGSYFLGRAYVAEYYFKKAINGITLNNSKDVYENMKKARILNPYEERFILNFSQTNMLIANNLVQNNKEKINEQDRLTITQAVQTAISEAKFLIGMNPNKSTYYENLANIYRNIIPLAAGADVWTVSAYQRAIVLDPANPGYRIGLGGVYYLLGQYNDAVNLFEQAVSLKPDWANANYNLAWAYFQNKEYDKATKTMQNVVNLIDKKTSSKDWDKANKELEDFKKMLPKKEESLDKINKQTESNLNLPTLPTAQISPKLELPKDASPEAK